MEFRRAFLGVILISLFAGSLYAVQNASVSASANLARWAPSNSPGSATTEGGNISNVNLTGTTQLTERWAAFFGNITGGTIVLRDAANTVYTWSYSTTNSSGRVCVSNSSTFPTGTMQAANPVDVNTLWNLGARVDNATNTLTLTGTNWLELSGTQVTCPSTACAVKDNSNFTTVATYNGNSASTNNFAFCTVTNSTGKNFKGESYNYELMVPTVPSGEGVPGPVMTYYFYLEIS